MTQEQYLLSFLPQITATTDPLQDVIDSQLKDYQETEEMLNTTKAEYAALEEPPMPGESSKPGCGTSICIGVVLFIFFLIVGVSFGSSLAIGGIGLLSVYIFGKIHNSIKKSNYETYLSNVQSYEERIEDLEREVKEKSEALQGKLAIRFEALRYALNKNLGLPYPMSSISLENYPKIKKCYLTLLEKKEAVDQISDSKKRQEANRAFIDEKIAFLYAHSLRAELSEEVYDEFKRQLLETGPGNMVLRQGNSAGRYSQGIGEIFRMPKYKEMLEDDHLTPIISKFRAVSKRNTKGWLFDDLDKKERQTSDMKDLLDAAKYEYDELMKVSKKVSYALNYARGCAYRNLYLATELVNYVNGSNRGGGLTMAHDKIGVPAIAQNSTTDFGFDGMGETQEISAIETISFIGNTVMDDQSLLRFAFNNPKVTLGVAAVATLGTILLSMFNDEDEYAQIQSQLTDSINKIADGYTDGKAGTLRAIEIISGIVKCNDGFLAIYEPLRKKVFDDGDLNLTKMEMMQLAAAANEYSKVAKAKVKE